MTNKDMLMMKIKESGMSISFICEKLNLSRSNFYRSLNGKRDFRQTEIVNLSKILCLKNSERDKIFLSKKEGGEI